MGLSNAASMGGTFNLTLFSCLTAVMSLSQSWFPFFESHEHTIVDGNAKYICVVVSLSLLLKLTQL